MYKSVNLRRAILIFSASILAAIISSLSVISTFAQDEVPVWFENLICDRDSQMYLAVIGLQVTEIIFVHRVAEIYPFRMIQYCLEQLGRVVAFARDNAVLD